MAAILEHVAAKLQSEAHEILERSPSCLRRAPRTRSAIHHIHLAGRAYRRQTIDKHGDTPLLDTGALQSSISHVVEALTPMWNQ